MSAVGWWFRRRWTLGFAPPFPSGPPAISSVVPATINAGNPGFYMTINGTNFRDGAIGYFDGLNLPTDFNGSTALRAWAPGGILITAGSYPVDVANPDAQQSNIIMFPVV